MTNEAISRSNGCRGLPSYSQNEVGRRVSFSSTVSVVSDNGDATESTTTSEWLSDAAVDDLSPRSLLSGRWTENKTETKNTRGVSVVELMDHSPGLNCPARKRLDFSESDRTSRPPIKSCKGNYSIPNLAKSEASSSSLVENNMNENGRSNDSATISPTNKVPMSPLITQTRDLRPRIDEKLIPPEYETCVRDISFVLEFVHFTHVLTLFTTIFPHIETSLKKRWVL